jgi:uncharacterized repeat protein (TIGR03803 family)
MPSAVTAADFIEIICNEVPGLPNNDLIQRRFMKTKQYLIQILLAGTLATTTFETRAGVVFTRLHSFGVYTNGAYPEAGLVQGSDGSFYGTTANGGTNGGYGTVFKISAGGVLTTLYSFTGGVDGAYPTGLVQGSDGNFYGTTFQGGANGYGTVFKISSYGVFASLYSFTDGRDGANPIAALIEGSDGNFYGTASQGGTGVGYNGYGTIFKISASGIFTSLFILGAHPSGGLVQASDGNFYGTTAAGDGTVFKISAAGVFTNLYAFTGLSDGCYPEGGLVQGSDGNLYGTTMEGGVGVTYSGYGTVFKISTNGTFTLLREFTGGNDGANPQAGLIQGSDGDFYGTTESGGVYDDGVVFRISASGAFGAQYSFTGGNDGAGPQAGLVQGNDGYLYGTTYSGGTNDVGAMFKISTNGLFSKLYSFIGGSDGINPQASLTLGNDGNFYGMTEGGGANGYGVVFKVNPSGAFTSLYSFTGGNDGASPVAGLIQGNDGNFYGTASQGGTNGYGTIFKISATGTFMALYSFTGGNDGADPDAGLIQGNDGNFYGTASQGGTNGYGTIFKISATGTFTALYSFTGGNDGADPDAGLIQGSDGNLYGTAQNGGTNSYGAIFKIGTGGDFTSLYSFTDRHDGASPESGLIQASDGNFYGMTPNGGTNGYGTIFKINAGGAFTALYSFTRGNDGANPYDGLALGSDGNLYGTAEGGGAYGNGSAFRINTNGVFVGLYSFAGGIDGMNPQAGLAQGSDGNFYGTTAEGGVGGNGTLFSISGATNPAIEFTASPTNGEPALTVQFNSPTMDSSGNTITSWNWNFGDGETSTLQNPSHSYTAAAIFTPTLMATNGENVAVISYGPQIIVSETNFEFTITNNAITITEYTGAGGAVFIPTAINGYPVTAISEDAFEYYPDLTSVTIPSSITSIGKQAFFDCSSLTNVTIPSSVTNIGDEAFSDCIQLTNITVVASNPAYSSLNGVLFDEAQATLIQFPVGLGGNYSIPSSVTSIGDDAFSECFNLTSVAISSNVTNIGDQAFFDCSRLTDVTIPGSVTSIGEMAFQYSGLVNIMIPSSVTNIGPGPFAGCSQLTNITVAASNPAYSSLDGVLFDKAQATLIQFPGGLGGNYTIPNGVYSIPNGVTSIGAFAFDYLTGLTNVIIPNSVTGIGEGAFNYCFDLTSVTIPNSVTSIGESAFSSCGHLTSVTIPNSVTNIGDLAFYGCDLTSVIIPSSVTSLGEEAFYGDTNLASVSIPNSITSIGDATFRACIRLKTVIIPDSITNIGAQAFYDCSSLTSVTIPSSVISIGGLAFEDCTELTSLTIDNKALSIAAFAFAYCSSLTKLYCEGNAPTVDPTGTAFYADSVTAYYLPGTTGWAAFTDNTYIPTALWYLPNPLILDNNLSMQINGFSFTISWATNILVVVQAATNLGNPVWMPVATNTLSNGTNYFNDSKWTNHPRRFYRVSAP